MIASIKAELRKIWTVRSTYAVLIFSLILLSIFAFWVEGIRAGINSSATTDPDKLARLIRDAITNLAFWGGLVGVLSVTQEYRHNLITYTLTSSRSRTQTMLTKIIAISLFAIFFTIFVTVLSVTFMYAGLIIKGLSLSPQVVPASIFWRIFVGSWGSSMFGFIVAMIVRQQVGAIAALFIIPAVFEPLVGLLLKDNRVYLPFTALQQVTGLQGSEMQTVLSPGLAALVSISYIVAGWLVAWFMFLRRDAN